ncbi:DeoR/GlpR family DNA-binding transcription regulator [Comamonas aquatica]|uniref:DeoR/GlpR family DNA-binding transcription regulator n=1 Tax=Comamonas aquatica TaxID=225991 RepID=A0AA42L8P4_9BURK|nr:DeoR/GlpR family DNA-binding transcription regulator [Comamonas aquatica]MDH0364801.1 DeoR/GlpR family DNA-binding transcription regulator [Comamonas aquatica]MDH1428865.1 DeoR/GlpR family DNA-binding transcription regulator [Comamonas aquatica]MDH1607598.1 DeoR/GlpR family DNA-binding transcription regulator [Comamonas aquatica]MDH1619344.1 DeoR/GlpR family DNA-binding transcription regulator [Comamonas aquatica]MDH2007316.1 DeoR/GlpR family DNA-binding transcription regulator [Comamonas a
MFKAERQQKILARMQETTSVSVKDLAKVFATSPITIRRDLIELGERGLLERTHGGAVAAQEVFAEGSARYEMYNYGERNDQQAQEKAAIAECAAQFISDGDNILINGGTTAHALAQALRGHQNLYVITNGLSVASVLGQGLHANVYVLAGRLDARKQATVSRPGDEGLPHLQVREAFLGVHALSAQGIYMRDPEDADMNKAFMGAARRVTVLADYTKLHAFASFRINDWSSVQRLVTDAKADPDILNLLRQQGVEVVVAA